VINIDYVTVGNAGNAADTTGYGAVGYIYNIGKYEVTNWLHNGQGSGSTETGAYTLSGNTGIITKNVGATVWLPSEDEWYKAAYYDPTPGASGNNYWLYPTQSDTAPTVGNANTLGDISNPGATSRTTLVAQTGTLKTATWPRWAVRQRIITLVRLTKEEMSGNGMTP
jgi:hypothetical protein